MITLLVAPLFLTLQNPNAVSSGREPLPFAAAAMWQDAIEVLPPSSVHIDGWLGDRIHVNAANRLLTVDIEPLLAGFRKKPGVHPWIGEHIGKWMHAATLAWSYTGDPRLRAKLDRAAAELIAAQEPDGYLGTYVPEKRFGLFEDADWDVWSHKYNLIGLLTYYQYTGNMPALDACRKIGDLLIKTFGVGKKSILSAGTHMGMAATSVLEPMVLLYRNTANPRYLAFAKQIVNSWEESNGPRILSTLLTVKQVNKTANGKAYEMLSNLVGLCELARATGDKQYAAPVLNAWQDIVDKRLYITGSASRFEVFGDDYDLPNTGGSNIAETCVTTTWIQLNLQLLRLTGDAKYGNEIEKSLYNHLAAAQNPHGDDWCYYTPLQGKKPYDSGITCCHSSGPRGMALAPTTAFLKRTVNRTDVLLVSTFETSSAVLELDGQSVRIRQWSRFPFDGGSELRIETGHPSRFTLGFRVAPWAGPMMVTVNGKGHPCTEKQGWAVLPARIWSDGDRVAVQYKIASRIVLGQHGNTGAAVLEWGPFVMAYDASMNPGLPGANSVKLAALTGAHVVAGSSPLQVTANVASRRLTQATPAAFVPFADAGSSGGAYRVWLPAPGTNAEGAESVLADGRESRSRQGNAEGSILDDGASQFVVTFDGKKQDEDWFAVTLDHPVTVGRIEFVGGQIFHDGGWFDTSGGKPIVQVQREAGSKWERLSEISDYPTTTATDCGPLIDEAHRKFTIRLTIPQTVFGVRVVGKPACGDNPLQAFSSCAGLFAYAAGR